MAAKEGITTRRKSPALSRHPPTAKVPVGAHPRRAPCMRGRNSVSRAGEPYRTLTPPRLALGDLHLPVGMPAAARRSPLFVAAVNPLFAHPPPPRLRVCRSCFFRSLFRKFPKFLGAGCRGGEKAAAGGRGRGRSTDADPLARSPTRRIDQITTPPETFQWPTRPPQTEKKRHGNRKDTTILHWTPLGLALSCAGERMARDSHRHNACVRSCVFQSSHGIFVFPDVYW